MEGDHFSLCWNNFHSNLSSGFHSLLKDEDLVDVTLAAEGKFIKAHKAVLSVCSPFFKDLFRVNPCEHPIVILPDVNYDALRSLMQFMYQGEVSVSQEEIAVFMRVAEVLKVKGLTDNNNSDASNGFTTPSSLDSKQNLLKRPRYIKKFTRPLNPYRPPDQPYKLQKSPPPHSPASQPSPVPSPGLKKSPPPTIKSPPPSTCTSQSSSERASPRDLSTSNQTPSSVRDLSATNPVSSGCARDLSTTNQVPDTPPSTSFPLLKPKDEPVDHSEEETGSQSGMDDIGMDIGNMLDTTLGESQGGFAGWPSAEMARAMMQQQDTSSPGTIQCILGRRGNPRLIVDGYVFYKKSVYKGKAFWYCKHSRSPEKCQAVCWTMNGNIVKWPYMHSHPVIPDVFNPEEDTEVPIENMQEVLWQTSLSTQPQPAMFLKSGRGQVVLIHNGHIYTNHSRHTHYGLWVCVKQKKLKCRGCVWTLQPGSIVLNFMAHNHPELHEDIRRLQITSSSISPELRL